MAIIRDEETGGIMMIPLFVDWGIKRCNIAGCRNKPTTIITGEDAEGQGQFGLCEKHWHYLSDTPGKKEIRLEFDQFDAFAATTNPRPEVQ
ncbi:MAG: hypothetical protein E3J26_03505 [Candidatus Zixiibacteriota bacterium]|nr:MAG: hypothetical protein E3J26_03505 [candidate division Zixibacteria bacterium]